MYKYLTFLVLFVLLIIGCNKKTTNNSSSLASDANKLNIQAIYKPSKGHKYYNIHKTGIGPFGIGSSYSNFVSIIQFDSASIEGYYLVLYDNNHEKILLLGDKNWNLSNVVQYIKIHSNKYRTSNGIHVGMSINELTNILKRNIEVIYENLEGESESIFPKEFQTDNDNHTLKYIFSIELKSYDNKKIGIYDVTNDGFSDYLITTNFRTNGYISLITIGNWN